MTPDRKHYLGNLYYVVSFFVLGRYTRVYFLHVIARLEPASEFGDRVGDNPVVFERTYYLGDYSIANVGMIITSPFVWVIIVQFWRYVISEDNADPEVGVIYG